MADHDWIKNKAAMNEFNKKHDKCFQDAVTIMLNHKEIKKDSQRLTKIKPLINKYNWERINFPSEKHDWKRFLKNNVTVAFNVLYAKKEKICPASVSKHNSNRKKHIILLIISNRKTQS